MIPPQFGCAQQSSLLPCMETSRSPGEGDDGQLLAVEEVEEADGVASLAQ